MWVFPTPEGPRRIIFSCLSTKDRDLKPSKTDERILELPMTNIKITHF